MTETHPPAPADSGHRPAWTWAAVAAAAVLTVLQKPWALFHAQLRAEDGSVHMVDQTL